MSAENEGKRPYQLDPAVNPTPQYIILVQHPEGAQEIQKMSIEELAAMLPSNANASPVFIPTPIVEARSYVLEGVRFCSIMLSWPKSQDVRFLNYQPKFCLYRYKEFMKSVKKDPITFVKTKRRIPSGYKHPDDGTIDIHNPSRTTEWVVPSLPDTRISFNFDFTQWFRLYTDEWNQTLNQTFQPTGLRHSKINIGAHTRRNMFVKFAIHITINGKVYRSEYSHELKIGYTRRRAILGQDKIWNGSEYEDNYHPMIQLIG